MTGPAVLIQELRALGYQPEEREVSGQRFAVFEFIIPVGARMAEQILLGLDTPPDWPETPPHGPHVSPPFDHPNGANHPSPLGGDFRHWSRPPADWSRTQKSARAYMRHLQTLFAQL
jgi:hypothetical protein